MRQQIGFIGCGKMGQAILKGLCNTGAVNRDRVLVSAATEETLAHVRKEFMVTTSSHNKEVANQCDILFLAIPPHIHEEVISEIKGDMKKSAIVVTIAAGVSLAQIEKEFGYSVKVVRTMPNTPVLVGAGMTVLSANQSINREELEDIRTLFRTFGEVEIIPEHLMDTIPAISGSSPAYVYMFIEALADGGVRSGLPRNVSYRLAAQAVLGAAKMVLETGKHPGELKDEVCTPGGSTIEAVTELEKNGFRSSVLSAMNMCTKKIKRM